MGLFGFLKGPVPQRTAPLAPSNSLTVAGSITTPATAPAPPKISEDHIPKSAKISGQCLQFKEGKPYLALIGQTFDAWGIVDVAGDTRSHIAVKDVPAAIVERTGASTIDEIAAFDRKIVLSHTKGFHELPREDAFDLIDTLRENLMAYVDEMKEILECALRDYADDAEGLRELLRETKNEFAVYWSKDLSGFRTKFCHRR